jgi:hypothetical protein
VVALLAPQITRAQGTTYLSNVSQPSAGSLAVGSDSWLAILFLSGTNASGYTVNSIQLTLTDATGNPSDFTVMLWDDSLSSASSLGTFSGPTDPTAAGIYTYTAPANLILSERNLYFIVVTSGTAVANGAYDWSVAGSGSYDQNGGWFPGFTGEGQVSTSTDGSSWNSIAGENVLQFAINATPIPEPSPSVLILLGSGILMYARRFCKKN